MREPISSYPRVRVQADGRQVLSQAGAVLLLETVRKTGLDQAISAALAPWRKPRAVHDPGKILLDVALAVALGGDCLADVAMLRCEPAVFGPVASDPTVSRLIDTLAASGDKALQAVRSARSEVRHRAWSLAGENAPDADCQVTVDLDGVLVIAHSDKQDAAATWKKTYGHHPLTAFVDHGPGGTGEPVAALLRPGNAGSNTAADHITTAQLALAQLPKHYRRGRQTLIRTDSRRHPRLRVLAREAGRWLSYSVGMTVTEAIHEHVLKVPASAWTPAVEADGEARDGAWVAELTGKLLDDWPKGMRLIVRKERPHPGAQLRITDADGMRITCFATNTTGFKPIAELELRHRLRARAEDRIRAARATGLRNLPLHDTAQNRVWMEIVQIALDLLAWMPMLALTGRARLWEPRRLRFRLFSAAGQLVTTGRRRILRLARHWPWTGEITAALERLALLPDPG
ncbi:IS1380 family transposase [Streptomyces sp. RPA4-2]|uniref:IS1380 family transposase n=1 Tax=Streptomyces sp. RPA4-2 TaxID=2721244 RepID=UPI0034E84D9E